MHGAKKKRPVRYLDEARSTASSFFVMESTAFSRTDILRFTTSSASSSGSNLIVSFSLATCGLLSSMLTATETCGAAAGGRG